MKIVLQLYVVCCLFLAPMCQAEEADIQENDYTLHADPSDRLVTIMQNLLLVVDKGNIDEPVNFTRDEMIKLIETVEELLFYAELMTTNIPATQLEENEDVIFSALAGKLYDEALNVQQLAKNYDFDVSDQRHEYYFNDAFERLSRTCAACHQLFRD